MTTDEKDADEARHDAIFRAAGWVLASIDDVNNGIRYPNTLQQDGGNEKDAEIAALKAQAIADREAVASLALDMGFSTGHGDTIADILLEVRPQIEALKARVVELHTAASTGAKWMDWWLGESLCDCENGHHCGWDDRAAELQHINSVLQEPQP